VRTRLWPHELVFHFHESPSTQGVRSVLRESRLLEPQSLRVIQLVAFSNGEWHSGRLLRQDGYLSWMQSVLQ